MAIFLSHLGDAGKTLRCDDACWQPEPDGEEVVIPLHDDATGFLDARSLEILKKLAPEIREPVHYRSILPPVSVHHAIDEEDFQDRLERLSPEECNYLAEKILDGSECLLCISPDSARIFIDLLEKKAPGEATQRIRDLYKSSTGYEV